MSAASEKTYLTLDEYIDVMQSLGKKVTVLRPWAEDHASVVKARSAKKYVLKDGEDKEFTTYRGLPVVPTGHRR